MLFNYLEVSMVFVLEKIIIIIVLLKFGIVPSVDGKRERSDEPDNEETPYE